MRSELPVSGAYRGDESVDSSGQLLSPGSRRTGNRSVGSYRADGSRRGHERAKSVDGRSEDGIYYNGGRVNPRDIPFRTPRDPSAASSLPSRPPMARSKSHEHRDPKKLHEHISGRKQKRDLSPNNSLGMSTIPTIVTGDSSTCSTITMDASIFSHTPRGNRHNHKGSKRQWNTALVPVHETDSRGRDPEEDSRSNKIPAQVNVPDVEKDRIVLISNMPRDACQDHDVRSVSNGQKCREDGSHASRKRGDDPSSHEEGDLQRRNSKGSKHSKQNRRSKRSTDDQSHDRSKAHHSPRNRSRSRSPRRPKGDTSFSSEPSAASSYCSRSVRSHSSHHSIRHDIDPNGYCSHHSDIRLMKPDDRDPNFWCVVRKKCPECISEDCPSVFSGADYSAYSNVSSRTPFDDEGSVHSIESSKGSSFFLASLQTPEEIEEEEDTRRLKRRLAARAYHFPGNTWCEDWFQYLSNTHTVLGLFFHHPLHPLKVQERLVILFGSIAIGLTISNLTYMHFIRNGVEVDEELFRVNLTWLGLSEAIITKLMITLWTLGSFLHTIFDLGLWHMKACTLCRYGGQIDDRIARWGRVTGLFIVVTAMAAGSYAVLLRASIEYKGEGSEGSSVEEAIRNNEFYEIDFAGKRSFRFLLGYLVEFLLAMFVYYPIAVTIIFSGVLGCGGRIPVLGGRPREIKRERKYEMSKKSPRILKTFSNLGGGDLGAEDEKTSDICSMGSASYRSGIGSMRSYRSDMEENRIL